MRILFTLVVLFSCLRMAIADHRINIDRLSCRSDDSMEGNSNSKTHSPSASQGSTYERIATSFQTAIEWAKEALAEIEKPAIERGQQHVIRRRAINQQLEDMIGSDNSEDMKTIRAYLKHIVKFTFSSDDMWDEDGEWTKTKSVQDVEILCDASHVRQLDVPIRAWIRGPSDGYNYVVGNNHSPLTHVDVRRREFIGHSDEVVKLKQGFRQSTFTQWPDWYKKQFGQYDTVSRIPNTLVFNPKWLATLQKRNSWSPLNPSNIELLKRDPSTWTKVFDCFGEFLEIFVNVDSRMIAPYFRETRVDRLVGFEFMALRYLVRTDGGQRGEVSDNRVYRAVFQKKLYVADVIAWFAFALQLITKYGHTITREGELVKLGSTT